MGGAGGDALTEPVRRVNRPLASVVLTATLLAGCGGSGGSHGSAGTSSSTPSASPSPGSVSAPGPAPGLPTVRLARSLRLGSPAFSQGGSIPREHTCDGRDLSLPLSWSGVPSGTRELVLVMRDPSAPTGDFVHWAVAGIAPTTSGVQAGGIPAGAVQGRNGFGTVGYRGPCPPRGDKAHQYVLTLSALGSRSGLTSAGFAPDRLHGAALAFATLVGTYARR